MNQITNKITRNSIERCQTSIKPFLRGAARAIFVVLRKMKALIRFFTDKNFRSIICLQLRYPKKIHQTTTFTLKNRYPRIFSACRFYFNGKEDMKILSFGCSTGEEVLTLRKYFPTAHLIGADINSYCLSVCKKLKVDEKIKFIHSDQSTLLLNGPYDAIFCMAVLQRTPVKINDLEISDLSKIYPFEKFEKQIIELDQLLKPKGLFIIKYSQYLFEDTKIASNYQPIKNMDEYMEGYTLFDKNGKRITYPKPINTIFIKNDV